jgi:hypothetical protein
MAHTFYVVMQKRRDEEIYADLHKTDGTIYQTPEDAQEAWEAHPLRMHFHVVELVAQTVDEYNECLSSAPAPPLTPLLRVDIVAALADPEKRRRMLEGAQQFLKALADEPPHTLTGDDQ